MFREHQVCIFSRDIANFIFIKTNDVEIKDIEKIFSSLQGTIEINI